MQEYFSEIATYSKLRGINSTKEEVHEPVDK